MASSLQFKNDFGTSGGYSNGVSSGRVQNWTDTNLSGSHSTTVYWDDKAYGCSSRVYMTVTDTWSGVINSDNSITLDVKSSYSMNRTNIKTCGRDCSGAMMRDGRVYTDNKKTLFKTYAHCITSSGVFSTGSKNWSVKLTHGQSYSVGSFYVINHARGEQEGSDHTDYISAGMAFRNTLPAPAVAPTTSLFCDSVANSSKGTVNFVVSDWGCPSGNNCRLTSSVDWATDPDFDNIVTGGNGEKVLTPNTTYYIRGYASNGNKSSTKTCDFTTLATSSVYNYKFYTDQVSHITVQADYGSGACDIATILQIREKGTSSWRDITNTGVHGQEVVELRNVIQRGKQYEARTLTTNCAGTYVSDVYQFTPPPADSIVGQVTKHNDELDQNGLTSSLEWCYTVTSYARQEPSEDNPIESRFEYRLEGQDEWVTLDTTVSTTSPFTICGTELGLACGSTYYLRSYQKIGTVESYSPVVSHLTAACAEANDCVCQNLTYMTELICQTLNKIKEGQKTVYANCPTKELCDPYSDNPTWESILSRVTRFSQIISCLICSMSSLEFSVGEDNEIYTATEPGKKGQFVPLMQEVVEDGDWLVSSAAVKVAIDNLLGSTFHPIGTYEFYARDIDELKSQSDAEDGDKAVIMSMYYTYKDGSWEETDVVGYLDDLGVVIITKGTYAQHEFYWWDGKWNMFDADNSKIERRISRLEEKESTVVLDEDDNHNNMIALPITYSNNDIIRLASSKYPDEDVTVFLYDGGSTSTCFTLDTDTLNGAVGLC